MTVRKWALIFLLSIVSLTSSVSFSQTDVMVKRKVATVLFASLGGGVLGLSTLSFYGDPEEHTNNITLGALVGFVAGVGYIIYDSSRPNSAGYDSTQAFDLDLKTRRALATTAKAPSLVNITFDF